MTGELDLSALGLLAAKATPFVAAAPSPPPAIADLGPPSEAGGTGEITPEVLEAGRRLAKLPFERQTITSPESAVPSRLTKPAPQQNAAGAPAAQATFKAARISLQQYAAVCVELEPSRAAPVLSQYGLTRALNAAVSEELRARCAADPAVAAAWAEACATYRAWRHGVRR
jgi:hypothetical protein